MYKAAVRLLLEFFFLQYLPIKARSLNSFILAALYFFLKSRKYKLFILDKKGINS